MEIAEMKLMNSKQELMLKEIVKQLVIKVL